MLRIAADMTYRTARRVVIAVIGGTLLLLGVAMLVLPGPAVVIIPIGLAILSLEFLWARHWLHKLRRGISEFARDRRLRRYGERI